MGHRGDLYSVGVMMYELLAGRLPFVGATSMDVLLAHATEAPPSFEEVGLDGVFPAEVENVVRACLEKDPDDRPQSARELADRFQAAIGRPASRISARTPRPTRPSDSAVATRPQIDLGANGTAVRADAEVVTLTQTATVPKADTRTPIASPLAATPAPDGAALTFHAEAWMPESVAVMKLRGFCQDTDGEMVESGPGLVRLRFGRAPSNGMSGAFSWLGLSRRNAPVHVELHLLKLDPAKENKLTLAVHFRPVHPSLLSDPPWRDRCSKLFVELRSYLMAGQ
jgi:hypothetical protein